MERGEGRSFSYRHFGAFRLLLALLVLLQQYLANLAPQPLATDSLPYAVGGVAVLIFFCLSGFVITEAADVLYRTRPGAYLANRALRIIPHFLIAMAMAMAIYYGFYRYGTLRISRGDVLLPHVAFSLHNIVLNLMNAATSEDSSVQYRFLDVAWALRIEMLFYLAVFGSLCVIRLAPPLARRIGFGGAALGFAAIIAPLFCLSVLGHAPRTFHFLPYFTFGSALYFITLRRSRVAMLVGGLAVPAMIWQFLNAPLTNTAIGAHDNVAAEFAIFAVLLAGMTFLATRRFATGITADRYLGDLTYPLYLYHQNIMIIALSLTAGYSYTVLAIGIAASLVFVCAVHASIDPAIERIRNRVRGRDLRRTGKPVAQPGEADVAIAGLAVSVAPAGGAN